MMDVAFDRVPCTVQSSLRLFDGGCVAEAMREGLLRQALQFLAAADVVIAKGQGNLEGLWNISRDVYFLLTVKCERIARHLEVPVGGFVVWKYEADAARLGVPYSGA
jgi:uncharacterized protein with ATP-grasp and redox domains